MAVVAVAAVALLTVVIIVAMQRRHASPERRYRRDLRSIRRIQKGIRPADLDGTLMQNLDVTYGYDGR